MTINYARVGRDGPLKARHYIGGELAERAAVVYLEHSPDGIYLYRYTALGEFVGDTWHASKDDARQQAEFEFADELGPWTLVPANAGDLDQFTIAICADDSTG